MSDVKHIIDVASVSTLVATFLGWLPHIAALLTVIWGVIRIYGAILEVKIKRQQLRELTGR